MQIIIIILKIAFSIITFIAGLYYIIPYLRQKNLIEVNFRPDSTAKRDDVGGVIPEYVRRPKPTPEPTTRPTIIKTFEREKPPDLLDFEWANEHGHAIRIGYNLFSGHWRNSLEGREDKI